MEKTIGYVISERNNFGGWAYNGHSIYYLAKKVAILDENGEIKETYYSSLADRFAYRDKIITQFRGMEVEKI